MRRETIDGRGEGIMFLDERAATLAHELRTPVQAVSLAIEAVREACDEHPAARNARDIAERGLRQISQIIESEFGVARRAWPGTGRRHEPVDVRAVVARSVELAMPLIRDRRHRLRVVLEPDLPALHGDETRLVQLFTNLLTNAAKFTPVGGAITLRGRATAGGLEVSVSDNGVGISPEALRQVFDRYFRSDPTDARAVGLGLGLALVKAFAEQHGGSVRAESNGPGLGASFIVSFPLVRSCLDK